jgi:hypothetical protein
VESGIEARRVMTSDAELIGRSLAGDGEAFVEVIGPRVARGRFEAGVAGGRDQGERGLSAG